VPLYARILGLFLLNILVIAAAFVLVFRMQFHLGLDSFLAGQANQRVRALSDVVIRELQEASSGDIDAVLQRFSDSFGVDLYLFRANGDQLGGPAVVLPPEIDRALRRQGGGRGRLGVPENEGELPRGRRFGQTLPDADSIGEPPPAPPGNVNDPLLEPPPELQSGPPFRRGNPDAGRGFGPGPRGPEGSVRQGVPPNFFLKSTRPTRYWAGAFFPSRPLALGNPPNVLLIASDSITGGGLFFDFAPWLVAGIGGLVLSCLIWLPFVRSITRSLGQMTRTTEAISVGRFDTRVDTRRNDELGRLSEAINDMAGRLEGFVSGQRRFLGDIAHELCSPLARIQTALGILEQRADTRIQSYVKDLQEEAEHMSQLVGELLSFSKASMDRSRIQLERTLIAGAVAGAVRREQVEGVSIQQNIPAELAALASAELLQRAVANLLRNAVRYAGQAGAVTLAAWAEAGEVVIEVSDHGPGVPADSLAKLFDPFYRVDASRTRDTGGVGLGLTIVKTCVESCGGTVSAENRPEGGLRVEIRLPAAPPATD
jgi:two-component system sensor histidine kinase CpxA